MFRNRPRLTGMVFGLGVAALCTLLGFRLSAIQRLELQSLDFRFRRVSTLERDPRTNQFRYTIDNTGTHPKLTFQTLVGAEMVGTEIQGVWSSNIVITTNADGTVTRTQDGNVMILGRGIETVTFETTLSGKFRVTAVVKKLNRRTGKLEDTSQQIYARPDN